MVTIRSHHEYLETRYFSAFDGVRVFAALAVFLYHVDPDLFRWIDGERGLRWFFVLSGFLITSLLLRVEDQQGSVSVFPFVVRRISRILPTYYLAVAAVFLFEILLFRSEGRLASWSKDWFYYLTVNADIPIAMDTPDIAFPIAWTLGIEEKFYVLWPLIGFGLMARNWTARMVCMSTTFVTLALLGAAGVTAPAVLVLQPFQPIFAGCIVALLLHKKTVYDAVTRLVRMLPTWLVLLAVVFPVEVMSFGSFNGIRLAYTVLVAVAIAHLVMRPSGLARHLSSGAMKWLAPRSFAFYLTHTLVLELVAEPISFFGVEGNLRSILVAVVALPATVLLSHVIYVYFERPLTERGRAFAQRERVVSHQLQQS